MEKSSLDLSRMTSLFKAIDEELAMFSLTTCNLWLMSSHKRDKNVDGCYLIFRRCPHHLHYQISYSSSLFSIPTSIALGKNRILFLAPNLARYRVADVGSLGFQARKVSRVFRHDQVTTQMA